MSMRRLQVQDALKREFHYVFRENPYPWVPQVRLHGLGRGPQTIGGVEVSALPVMHLQVARFGVQHWQIAYITDANAFSPEHWERLEGVEVLVLNALRKEPHISHFNLEEALEVIERVGPKQAYLTHISHLLGKHEDIQAELPKGSPSVGMACAFPAMTRILHTLFVAPIGRLPYALLYPLADVLSQCLWWSGYRR